MAVEFDIQPLTRKCAITGRELAVGERYHGVLLDKDGKLRRVDYSAEAWDNAPPAAVAHWIGKIPAADKPKKPIFHDNLLLDCFQHLSESTAIDRLQLRYVIGLLLMRRKRFKFEDSRKQPNGQTVMILQDAKNGARHEVVDPRLSSQEIEMVQDEVFRLMGWE